MEGTKHTGWGKVRKYAMQTRNPLVESSDFSQVDPELCIKLISIPTLKHFSALCPKLRECSASWMAQFLDLGGLDVLLSAVEHLSASRVFHISMMDAVTALQGVQCIKEIMNSGTGLARLEASSKLVTQLAHGKRLVLFGETKGVRGHC